MCYEKISEPEFGHHRVLLVSMDLALNPAENQDNPSLEDGWMSSAPTPSRAVDVLDPE